MSMTPGANPSGDLEFSCLGCGSILKIPASAAGRPARCPKCGSVQQTTAPAPGSAGSASPSVPESASTSAGTTIAATPPLPGPPGSAPSPLVPAAPPSFTVAGVTPFRTAPPPAAGAGLSPSKLTAGRTRIENETDTKRLFDRIMSEISKMYVGQDELVLGTLVALFSNGHVLIESVPGLGKTLFVRSLGRVLGCRFGRIQFTADLMPSDITGAPIFDLKNQEFRFRPGPVFTQLLLADEINRSPAKTHAALLETMQEFRVTVDGLSHPLERPFLVMATQNPIESEGTYNLPEAQLDRFMFKLVADYPREDEEARILKLHSSQQDINDRLEHQLETVTSPSEILATTMLCSEVRVDDRLVDYINKIVRLTRKWPQFHLGASPRAGIALMQASRALAAFSGRDYAVPDDVVQIALPALRHRVILTAEAEVEGRKVDELLTELVRSVEVPRL